MLSRIEMYLSSVPMGRETILKRVLEPVMAEYDVIIIDCAPNLGNLTANDMVAADGLIVPMCAQYLSAKGLDLLLGQYSDARTLNPGLQIIGALITMKDPNRNMQGQGRRKPAKPEGTGTARVRHHHPQRRRRGGCVHQRAKRHRV